MKKIFLLLLVLFAFTTGFRKSSQIAIDQLRLNQIQVIGSHNSYKQQIEPALLAVISKRDSAAAKSLDYSHIPLSKQLDLGLLNLEIDVLADQKGGKYAKPLGFSLTGDDKGLAAYDPEGVMLQPGFKVLHIPDIDFKSHHKTFAQCLQELKKWSDSHKGHYPIFITMNAKEGGIQIPGASVPEQFSSEVFDLLDQEILIHLGKTKIITPDDVRGSYPSLQKAVLAKNWPELKEAQGKFIFILDEHDHKRAAYIKGHPSLKGRVMFVDAAPDSPEAAILIMNEPKEQLQDIQKMVKKGYIVRTRADANTVEARNNDKSRFAAALASGAQIITTDYYFPSKHFDSPYQVSFGDNMYFRPNQLTSK